MIGPDDHARIAAAIQRAESATSAEIWCVLAEDVSRYREVPVAVGAAAALALPPAAILLGLRPWTLADFGNGWTEAPNLGEAVSASLAVYAIGQAVVFAAAAFLAAVPAVRRRLTPRVLKSHRVRRAALAHFASLGIASGRGRSGVLIFAALADRQVELVADDALHARVGEEAWGRALAALVRGMRGSDPAAGLIEAVEICGRALATEFPPDGVARPGGDGVVELR